MTSSVSPDFILVGPQKCATTWIYECLADHPEVFVPDTDSVHYFDIHYGEGDDWYHEFFADYDGEPVVGETTPSYIRDSFSPRRIHETVPNTKILFSLRNPIDRAFSHYWHEKEKSKINFEFEEVFENYDLYQNWIETGQYHYHLERYRKFFDDEAIGVFFFDDLVADDAQFIADIYEFIGADPTFTPSRIDEKVNQAWNRFDSDLLNRLYRAGFDAVLEYGPMSVRKALRPIHESVQESKIPFVTGQSEYERGIHAETRRRLEAHFLDDAARLAQDFDRDLDDWFEYHDLSA